MKKDVIIFIEIGQYGYDYSIINVINNLKDYYQIEYLGLYEQKPIVSNKDLKVNHIKIKCGKLTRKIEFTLRVWKILRQKNNVGVINLGYYLFCSPLVFLLGRNKTLVQFKTGFIEKNNFIRLIKNYILRKESVLFPNITTLSKDLKEYLKLPNHSQIFELGANVPKISLEGKLSERLNMLYIGTFFERNINVFIEGLKYHCQKFPSEEINFTIIGYGNELEESQIANSIKFVPKNLRVSILGRKQPNELPSFYLSNSIGISYVPLKPQFLFQPVTKTIEYLLNGMLVIGTKLKGNEQLIHQQNGVLIEEEPESISNGIIQVRSLLEKKIERKIIAKEVKKYTWKNLIDTQYRPLLQKIISNE